MIAKSIPLFLTRLQSILPCHFETSIPFALPSLTVRLSVSAFAPFSSVISAFSGSCLSSAVSALTVGAGAADELSAALFFQPQTENSKAAAAKRHKIFLDFNFITASLHINNEKAVKKGYKKSVFARNTIGNVNSHSARLR